MFAHSCVSRPAVDFFRNDFDQLFTELFRPAARSRAVNRAAFAPRTSPLPALNVWEEEGSFRVEAEVPGLKAEDLEIIVVGGEVTISGTRKNVLPEGMKLHRQERTTGEFKRVLKLQTQLNPAEVTASLHDGVLSITLPKAEETKPRKIAISQRAA